MKPEIKIYFEKGYLCINNIPLPFEERFLDIFCPPDLESTIKYYEPFCRHLGFILDSIEYLDSIIGFIAKYVKNDYENKSIKIKTELIEYFNNEPFFRVFVEHGIGLKNESTD